MLVTVVAHYPDDQAEVFDVGNRMISETLCLRLLQEFNCDFPGKYKVKIYDDGSNQAVATDQHGDKVYLFFQETVTILE